MVATLEPLSTRIPKQQGHLLTRGPRGSWTFSGRERLTGNREKGLAKALYLAVWEEENLRIATKSGSEIAFRHNDIQSIMLNFNARCWADRVRVAVLNPKVRQGGVSTKWQADLFGLSVLSAKGGVRFNAGTVAHIEESAKVIFAMSRKFETCLGPSWKLPLESRQQGRLEWRGTGGFIQIASAKLGDALFRGPTLNAFHGSEVANWSDAGLDASLAFKAAMGALAPGPDSMIGLESTAKGRDAFFHPKILRAMKGEGELQLVFLPWFLERGYAMTWRDYTFARRGERLRARFERTPEEESLAEELRDVVVRPGEEWFRYAVDLTDEQLIWRRAQTETDCDGDPAAFRRGYPSTIEECFASTTTGKFEEAVDHYLSEARVADEVGSLRRGERGLEFVEGEDGDLLVWERPRQGHDYVIGADVAGEEDVGKDFDAAYVLHKRTMTVVAALHGKFDGDVFADKLAMLGRWFNDALLAPERGKNPSVALALKKGGYPRLYHYVNPEAPRTTPRPGWTTSSKSRPLIVDGLAAVCRDRRLRSKCGALAEEMSTFVWSERRHRCQAAPGKNDDRVIAAAIAVHLCDPRADLGALTNGAATKPPSDGGDVYRAFMREQEEEQRRERISFDGDGYVI